MKRDTEPHDPPRRRHSGLRRRSPAFLALCAALAAGGLRGQDREEPGPLPALRGTFFRLPVFRRGDTNVDEQVDLSDSIDLLSFLFVGDREPPRCRNAADSNRDGRLDISDASFALGYLFLGSAPPPATSLDACDEHTRPS
ncbi:MAG: hypothetical protein O7J95_14425 [Planctomycetota bacterium]|nr:hypothetical protein [Planctomycetota bacterium]